MPYRALIFEMSLEGHRANYVAILARALLDLNIDVTIAFPEAQKSTPEYSEFLTSLENLVTFAHVAPLQLGKPMAIAKHSFQEFVRVINQEKPDHVYVPYADGLAQVWGTQFIPSRCIPPRTIVEGLIMRGNVAYENRRLKDWLLARLSFTLLKRSAFTKVHFLDPLVHRFVRRHYPNFAKSTALMPEAIESSIQVNKAHAKKELGIGENEILVTCPGGVGAWKGTDQLIAATLRAQKRSGLPLVLLLLGKHEQRIADLLENRYADELKRGQIVSINRFATAKEFSLAFSAADVVCVPYPRHIGSASILLRAAKLEKSIVASDWGWVGWATKRFRLGRTCNVNNVEDFAANIIAAIDSRATKDNIKYASRFLRLHTDENHVSHWTCLFRKNL